MRRGSVVWAVLNLAQLAYWLGARLARTVTKRGRTVFAWLTDRRRPEGPTAGLTGCHHSCRWDPLIVEWVAVFAPDAGSVAGMSGELRPLLWAAFWRADEVRASSRFSLTSA